MRKNVVEQPPREPDGLQAASALAATWWSLNRENSDAELSAEKDLRFAARLRGGLAKLRQNHGSEAVLLVPFNRLERINAKCTEFKPKTRGEFITCCRLGCRGGVIMSRAANMEVRVENLLVSSNHHLQLT